jgi:hypothetical protein
LALLIATMTSGTTVTVDLIHGGRQKAVSLTLGTRHAPLPSAAMK